MPRKPSPPIRDAARQYVAVVAKRSGSESVTYGLRSLLGRMADAMSNRQIGGVTAGDIEDWFYGPGGLAETCARSTLGKYRNDVKGFLSWCHRRGWHTSDAETLLEGIRDKSTRTGRERLRLTEPQLFSLADAATEPRDRALALFVIHTAVRISEAKALRVRQVRLDAAEVRVRVLKSREDDVLRLAAPLVAELRAWLTHYHNAAAVDPDAYLFPAMTRPRFGQAQGYNPPQRISNPVQIFRRLAADAGVPLERGDGWHTVRRSVARLFFDACSHRGHDQALRMTSAFLHHKNTATTEIYLGLRLERMARDQVMLEGFLAPPARDNVIPLGRVTDGG